MPDLARIGCDAMASQQYRQSYEPGFISAVRFGARRLGGNIASIGETRTHQGIAGSQQGIADTRQDIAGTPRQIISAGVHAGNCMKNPMCEAL
jgi:hypothetical protein